MRSTGSMWQVGTSGARFQDEVQGDEPAAQLHPHERIEVERLEGPEVDMVTEFGKGFIECGIQSDDRTAHRRSLGRVLQQANELVPHGRYMNPLSTMQALNLSPSVMALS